MLQLFDKGRHCRTENIVLIAAFFLIVVYFFNSLFKRNLKRNFSLKKKTKENKMYT